jgi:hypothetical protein
MKKHSQRGAATLVVVMVLFFIISMVAAYTSRNMIFEQRTGTNLYRATQSLEAADAGLQWAMMQLNSGRIDDACVASTSLSNSTFRDRYIQPDPATGMLSPRAQSGGGELTPTCVFDRANGRWQCSCPVDDDPSLTAPTTGEIAPAFRVRMRPLSGSIAAARVGLIRVEVVGCTRLDDDCLKPGDAGVVNEGRTVAAGIAMLGGHAMTMPRAALTARGDVSAASLVVSNVRFLDGGLTIHARGTINPGILLSTISGNALGGATIFGDTTLDVPALAPYTAAQRFFSSIFLLTPEVWIQQPAVVSVDCTSGCTASQIRDEIARRPGSPLFINGDVSIDSSGDFGTPTAPVLMVINGDLAFSTTGVTIHGLVVIRPADPITGWVTSGAGTFNGAVVVDGAVTGSGSHSIEYNGTVLTALRATVGNYILVPGSWRDWVMP